LYRRAKELIPGGTQLLSKRPEFFAPDQWPAYYRSAQGCEVVDLDGNTLLDMSTTGIGACLLGYADPDVNAAVIKCVKDGSMCSLNPPDEVTLAELLIKLHPWAENVRYFRTGGEAMAAAVRLARGTTGRDLIAFCGYHGWHDWYLAANLSNDGSSDKLRGHLLPGLSPIGVPSHLAGTAFPFTYNNIDELLNIVNHHGKKLAAVVMEPTRSVDPHTGFLERVRELCDQVGAALIIDEITTGWRFTLGGVHLKYELQPDIAVFAKAMSNGYPMAAVVGRAKLMESAHESFISSTYWTEGIGPAASLATLRKMSTINLPLHLHRIGERFRNGLDAIAVQHHVPLKVQGHSPLLSIVIDDPNASALQTLLTVRMLSHNILTGSSFYPNWAHQERHIDMFLAAVDEVLPELAEAIRLSDVERRIGGPVKHTGFKRLA